METRRGSLTVRTTGKDLEVSNGCVAVRFVLRDGGYAQEFYAADARGRFELLLSSIHKNLIVASEHRACTSPMIAGERNHLFGVCRESLRMAYTGAEVEHHDEHKVTVRLSGAVGVHNLKCRLTLQANSTAVYTHAEDDIIRRGSDPVLEYLMSSFAFLPATRSAASDAGLDYAWAPNLRPGNDQLIGDCAFHSPAVMVQSGRLAAALIPDMDVLARDRQMPASLDLDLDNGLLFAPLLSYGLCGYEPTDDGNYCRHDVAMSSRLMRSHVSYAYYLILDANCRPRSIYQQAARFLWDRYGAAAPLARTQPDIRYLRLAAPDSEIPVPPDAWAAYGRCATGARTGDESLGNEAGRMIDLTLSAPQDHGLFPTCFDASRGRWSGCESGIDGAFYHTVECSRQAYWLLKWHRNAESSRRILSYVRRYADYIISSRLRTGAIPSWYTKDLMPMSPLRSSAQTAASAILLAELARATGLQKYRRAFQQSASFVLKEAAGKRLYLDHTLLDEDAGCSLVCPDPHTSDSPRSAQAVLWVARMCLDLYEFTSDRAHLQQALAILDEMCLFQCVHDATWAREPGAYGMCVQGNLGWRRDPELTAEFGLTALRAGAMTGEREYFERGAAALRAAVGCDQLSRQSEDRIAAEVALAKSEFGAAFVHVGRKWGAAVLEPSLTLLELKPSEISLELNGRHRNGSRRVVFGGMRGAAYTVTINGEKLACSRDEMERGIVIPGHDSEDVVPRSA